MKPAETETDAALLARVRLLHLASPATPVGSYAYSQGLEWACHAGWVADEKGLRDWLSGALEYPLARADLPLLGRLWRACAAGDWQAVERWNALLLALRETAELRAEELRRGRALANWLAGLGMDDGKTPLFRPGISPGISYAALYAYAASAWGAALADAALAYVWSWLENQAIAAVKLIPLGQTQGQRALSTVAARLPAVVEGAMAREDHEIGFSAPALAIASARHESQYSRLFRS